MVHVALNRGLLRTITVLLTFQVLTIILVLVSAANVGGKLPLGQQGTPEAHIQDNKAHQKQVGLSKNSSQCLQQSACGAVSVSHEQRTDMRRGSKVRKPQRSVVYAQSGSYNSC